MNAENILRDAMIALHEQLSELELDIAGIDEGEQPKRVRDQFRALWQHQHDAIAQFYDLDVFLDRRVITSAVSFLAEFPQVKDEYTGGGCRAWRLDLTDGSHLLLTDDGGAMPPEFNDDEVTVGHYDADGEPFDAWSCSVFTWGDAATYVRDVCAGRAA